MKKVMLVLAVAALGFTSCASEECDKENCDHKDSTEETTDHNEEEAEEIEALLHAL